MRTNNTTEAHIARIVKLWPNAFDAYSLFKAGRFSSLVMRKVEYIPIRTSLGFAYILINHDKRECTFSFMGTELEFDSWGQNVDALKRVAIPNIEDEESAKDAPRVYQGLWDVYNLCIEPIHETVYKYKKDDYSFWSTGHSQGGAVSQTCKLDIDQTFGLDINTEAFASQRVGGKRFASFMDGRNLGRCNVLHDGVVHLPPYVMGYRHAGELAELKAFYFPGVSRIVNHYQTTYNRKINNIRKYLV